MAAHQQAHLLEVQGSSSLPLTCGIDHGVFEAADVVGFYCMSSAKALDGGPCRYRLGPAMLFVFLKSHLVAIQSLRLMLPMAHREVVAQRSFSAIMSWILGVRSDQGHHLCWSVSLVARYRLPLPEMYFVDSFRISVAPQCPAEITETRFLVDVNLAHETAGLLGRAG